MLIALAGLPGAGLWTPVAHVVAKERRRGDPGQGAHACRPVSKSPEWMSLSLI